MSGIQCIIAELAHAALIAASGSFLHLEDGMQMGIQFIGNKRFLHVIVDTDVISFSDILGRSKRRSKEDGYSFSISLVSCWKLSFSVLKT